MTTRTVKQHIISLATLPLCAVAVLLFSAANVDATSITMTETKVRVTGNNVNLRSEPKSNAEILKQVSVGVELDARFSTHVSGLIVDEWVRVTPPQEVNFWIYSALVENGEVNVAKAQIRSGAGLTFSVVGQVERGTKIVERGRVGDWIKIAPPEGTYAWISGKFVEVVAPPPPPPPPPPPQEEEKQEMPAEVFTEDSPQEVPADFSDELVEFPGEKQPLADPEHPNRTAFGRNRPDTTTNTTTSAVNKDRLSSGVAQGKLGRFSGQLAKAGATGTSPSRYRLMAREDGVMVVVAYVLGKEDQLESLLDKQMTIEGPIYWFRFNKDPAVLAEQIHLRK